MGWEVYVLQFLEPRHWTKILLLNRHTKEACLNERATAQFFLECMQLTCGCWTPQLQEALYDTHGSYPRTWFGFWALLTETMLHHRYTSPDHLVCDKWRWEKVADRQITRLNHQLKFICPAWHCGLQSLWQTFDKDIAVYRLSSEETCCANLHDDVVSESHTHNDFINRIKGRPFYEVASAFWATELSRPAKVSAVKMTTRPTRNFIQVMCQNVKNKSSDQISLEMMLTHWFKAKFVPYIENECLLLAELGRELTTEDYTARPDFLWVPFITRLIADRVNHPEVVQLLMTMTPSEFFKLLQTFDPEDSTTYLVLGIDLLELLMRNSEIFSADPPSFWDLDQKFIGPDPSFQDKSLTNVAVCKALDFWLAYNAHLKSALVAHVLIEYRSILRPMKFREGDRANLRDYCVFKSQEGQMSEQVIDLSGSHLAWPDSIQVTLPSKKIFPLGPMSAEDTVESRVDDERQQMTTATGFQDLVPADTGAVLLSLPLTRFGLQEFILSQHGGILIKSRQLLLDAGDFYWGYSVAD
eukprot:Blabericola_migrator_1__5714@NODE_28_length_19984_cov_212_654667_g25_i0_p4_GENE_NODE_28_length_19984_cov_212_654667_g25_i0NODE_28_length_19984_cov_212_654667_g25_i0_p4_ORF_typecomplete_len527_score81_48_NODE_28_length_19984_cov_212_654667_g25_i01816819748